MQPRRYHNIGIIVFSLLFPAVALLVQYIPNPMVPGAIVSLNMVLPVLAGYFFGPLSGLLAGSSGALLAALLLSDHYYLVGIYSLALAGALAGWIGKQRRLKILSAATILVAHALNMFTLLRTNLLTIPPDRVGITFLGLASESVIDIIATLLVIELFGRWLYRAERW